MWGGPENPQAQSNVFGFQSPELTQGHGDHGCPGRKIQRKFQVFVAPTENAGTPWIAFKLFWNQITWGDVWHVWPWRAESHLLRAQETQQPCTKVLNQRILGLKPLLGSRFAFQCHRIIIEIHGKLRIDGAKNLTSLRKKHLTADEPKIDPKISATDAGRCWKQQIWSMIPWMIMLIQWMIQWLRLLH